MMVTKRILIVDGEQDIREATQICLEVLCEWEVRTARSGKKGLMKAADEQPINLMVEEGQREPSIKAFNAQRYLYRILW